MQVTTLIRSHLSYILTFIVGVILTIIFFPSISYKKTYEEKINELSKKNEMLETNSNSLFSENTKLRQNIKTHIVYVKSKDGSETTTTDVETNNNSETNNDRQTTTNTRRTDEEQSSKLTQTTSNTVTEINAKRFMVGVGYTTNRDYMFMVSTRVLGSIYIGAMAETPINNIGAFIALSF